MAMSQTIEQAIEQFTYETDANGIKWFREHNITVTKQEWNEGRAKIYFYHNDLGKYEVGCFLNDAQSSKLREVSSANQNYRIVLVMGKQRNNNDGERLFNYFWNVKSFLGVINDAQKEMTPNGGFIDLDNIGIKPTDDDELETANEVFDRLQSNESSDQQIKPSNGVHKTTAHDDRQKEINLAMCFKSAVDIYLGKNLDGGIPMIEKTAEELFQSLQNRRKLHGLT